MMHELDLAKCAFNLLQWAHYGDVPDFKPKAHDEHCKKSAENDDEKQQTDDESEESTDDEIVDESAFEVEAKQDAWAEDVVGAASKDPLDGVSEMPDPDGLSVSLKALSTASALLDVETRNGP
jgi:hypothetical protein